MTHIILLKTCRVEITDYPEIGKKTISCVSGAQMCPKRGNDAGMYNTRCHFQTEWTQDEITTVKKNKIIKNEH